MNDMTVCIPLNADGTIHDRLGQANTVAICHVTTARSPTGPSTSSSGTRPTASTSSACTIPG